MIVKALERNLKERKKEVRRKSIIIREMKIEREKVK